MATATRTQCRYDHRPRNLIRTTRDIHCAIERGFPRSTARGRLTDSEVPVVTVEALNLEATQLQREVLRLQRVGFTGAQHDDHTAVRRRLDGPAVVDRITHVVVGEDVFSKRPVGASNFFPADGPERRPLASATCVMLQDILGGDLRSPLSNVFYACRSQLLHQPVHNVQEGMQRSVIQ